MKLTGYTDADGSMSEDRHAISGYAFLIHGGAVSWSANRQEIIALSTTEAEYVAITHATKEALWLHSLILQLFNLDLNSTTLFSDNKSAICYDSTGSPVLFSFPHVSLTFSLFYYCFILIVSP